MNYRDRIVRIFRDILDDMFPVRMGNAVVEKPNEMAIRQQLHAVLSGHNEVTNISMDVSDILMQQLPQIKEQLEKDIEAIYVGDPAAQSRTEIVIAYPGFYAVAAYRLAHALLHLRVPLVPRIITEHAHSHTGIDIHPAAEIGEYLCIDHGTGVVIGETAVIKDHVKIYQGVTLGALSVQNREMEGKRHPTIEDHVVIYAQATILGGNTVVGHHSIIGGNVWLTESVPPNSKIYYRSETSNDSIQL